jgi:Protein kinase domain
MAGLQLAAQQVVGGRYTITEPIVVGPTVATYRATCSPNRQVVLKLYGPGLSAPVTAALRAAATATMDLPRSSALEVLEVGVDAPLGATFVVTELSAWPSLTHLVELCPLSGADASALATSLARALGPAHERGLFHLSLKPNNVFVGPAPAYDVRLADFSATLARAALGRVDEPAAVPWLAPEQGLGRSPDPSSDVYSAALVLFFALTGHGPWERTERASRTAPVASARAAQLGVRLHPAWDAPFARALEIEPARRYRSIAQLAEAFEHAAKGEQTLDPLVADVRAAGPAAQPLALHAPVSIEAAPPRRRRGVPWIIAGGAGLALASAGLLVASRPGRSHPMPAPPVAASASPAAVTPAAPSSVASVAPPSAAVPEPPAAVTAAPATSARPAAHGVDSSHALLVVTCHPACDSVWVDGHPVAHAAEGALFPPGVHMVGANLAHHTSSVKPVLLGRGEVHPFDVDFSR